ncbi:M48 family metallopeptidase [Loktanella sp. S4079]|uniref:M48 family metallopeptidase n=1 Tax=Loktanella sp. S4079 TaxID=579483 RepID=UPI0005FA3466|nr:M48 family metallopeptidase [Loktanella sp. S4079]KJZ21004.1 peptidase M48 [Loktanella sp. S4079]
MIKIVPILLAVLYGLLMYRFSYWQTKRELDARSTLLADHSILALTQRMANALDIDRIKVHVHEIEQINGLAFGDGRIFITRGFLNKYQTGEVTAEEICSVIAHELGHVALGHSKRRVIDFSGQNAMGTVLAMIINRIIPGLGRWLATIAMRLVSAGLSRADEFEADAYASALLIKSGIGLDAQKSLFKKLEHLTGARGASVPAWLRSHPKTHQRIAAIEANEQKWG